MRSRLLLHVVHREPVHIQQNLVRLGEDHIAESDIRPGIGGAPEKVGSEVGRQDREQIVLPLLVVRCLATGFDIVTDLVVELGDANRDPLKVLDGFEVNAPHLRPHGFETYSAPVIDVPYEPAPRVDAIEGLSGLEDGLSLSA
jgi:hypothetical protein